MVSALRTCASCFGFILGVIVEVGLLLCALVQVASRQVGASFNYWVLLLCALVQVASTYACEPVVNLTLLLYALVQVASKSVI